MRNHLLRSLGIITSLQLTACIVGGAGSSPCTERMTGATAFARRLTGAVEFVSADGRETARADLTLDVYFPQGRVAGAPVILAHALGRPGTLASVTRGVLGPDLGATELRFSGPRGLDGTADLLGPDGGLRVQARQRVGQQFTDVNLTYGEATADLCPASDPPAGTLAPAPERIVPTRAIELSTTAPIDPAHAQVTVRAGGADVAVDVVATEAGLTLTPRAGAFPPNAALTVDASSVRDVAGRSLTLSAQPESVTTSAVVTDLTFASDPPSGALAMTSTEAAVRDGVLHLGITSGVAQPYQALIALGDPGAATRVRVRARTGCGVGVQPAVAVVSADGASSPLTLGCGASLEDVEVTRPGAGNVWLSIIAPVPSDETHRNRTPPSANAVELDAVTFE